MVEQPLPLLLVVTAVVFAALWLERHTRAGRLVHAPVIAITLGTLLGNSGVVAGASPVYQALEGPVLSLGLVWLLLSVRLEHLRASGPRMLIAFALASAATMGAVLAAAPLLVARFGDQAWRLAGPLTGTYIGGSINFVALARELELDPSLFLAATAADNITSSLWLLLCIALPGWLGAFYPHRAAPSAGGAAAVPEVPRLQLVELLGVGLVVVWLAQLLGGLVPAVPGVLWLTTLALGCALLRPVRRLEGAKFLGTLLMLFFFVVIGIYSRFAEVARVGWSVLAIIGFVVLVHGVLVLGIGRMLGFDLATLVVASQAAIGGPSTAMAVANARRYGELVLPGAAAGLLGYAIGNYAGYAVALVVRAFS